MRYRIKVRGLLDPGWSSQLAGMELTHAEEDGIPYTLLTGIVADQPALFGILDHLRDMNLLPISVLKIDEEE